MSVYVDSLNLFQRPDKAYTSKVEINVIKSCHLFADSKEELEGFIEEINYSRPKYQHELAIPHYDLLKDDRKKAIAAGAITVSTSDFNDRLLGIVRDKPRVYVDSLKPSIKNKKWKYDKSCHMVSDSLEELHAFGKEMKLNILWFQNRIGLPHYDLTEGMREKAVAMGAEEVSNAFIVDMIIKNRKIESKQKEEKAMPTEPVNKEAPVVAFDTETDLMSYENPISEVMCMSYCNAGELKGSLITPWEHDISKQLSVAWAMLQHHVGHNVAFDLSVLGYHYPDLMPHIFAALDNGIIHDTLIREKLLMLTLHGSIDYIEVNGCTVWLDYSLAGLENKYLHIDRSDLKEDADAPRMNYVMYKNVPLVNWDEKFVTYAVDDSINTGLIYEAQELERAKCIEITGHDPFKVETFRVKVSFALRLLECMGSRMDPAKVLEVAEKFRTEYNLPRLRGPLIKAGLLIEAVPATPYAKGTLVHTEACNALKKVKEHKASRKAKTCGCPPKMKGGVKEKSPTKPLFQYIWELAYKNPDIKAWPSDGCASELRKSDTYNAAIEEGAFMQYIIGMDIGHLGQPVLPDDIKLKTNEEWASNFAHLDPLLAIWAERKALNKIITDYLPKMFYTAPDGTEVPAETIRGSFYPLCLTGRSSSSASKLYPSRNEQNVDPRVRPCTIPRDGNVMVSTDYNGMELGTLAQKCVSLFGHSVMADNINSGTDNHAYLAAQIAAALDEHFINNLSILGILPTERDAVYKVFSEYKTLKEPCGSAVFCENFKTKHKQENSEDLDRPVLWSDFFAYYRLLAKPTGLGFPGGLGAATMVAYAKGTYKVTLSFDLAKKLRDVWMETYPEMKQYLDWIKKQCKDPNHSPIDVEQDDGSVKSKTFFAYDTPRGMHRARCGFCEAANGAGLQAFSAEGALEGLYQFQKTTWLAKEGDLLYGSFAINFLHDEIIWETPGPIVDKLKVQTVDKIMVDAMEVLTPDVKAGTESAAMLRWYKKAEPVIDDNGDLVPWVPEIVKKGVV